MILQSSPTIPKIEFHRVKTDFTELAFNFFRDGVTEDVSARTFRLRFFVSGVKVLEKSPTINTGGRVSFSLTSLDKAPLTGKPLLYLVEIDGETEKTICHGELIWGMGKSGNTGLQNAPDITLNFITATSEVLLSLGVVDLGSSSAAASAAVATEKAALAAADREATLAAKAQVEAAAVIAQTNAGLATEAATQAVTARNEAQELVENAVLGQAPLGEYNVDTNTPILTATPPAEAPIGAYYEITVEGEVGFSGSNFAEDDVLAVGGRLVKKDENTWYYAPPSNLALAKVVAVEGMFNRIPNKNLLDPARFDFTKRYSPGEGSVVSRSTTIFVFSGWIPVEEGKWYVYSIKDKSFGNSWVDGGYCTSEGQTTGITPITYSAPASGIGRKFQVPIGQGITHVVFNLICEEGSNDFDGLHQLEEGELATEYTPYSTRFELNPTHLPKNVVLEDQLGGEIVENNSKLVTGGQVYEEVLPLKQEMEKLSPILIDIPKKNLLNPENFDFTKRYSPGEADIRGRGGTVFAFSGYIPVKEGYWYTYSIQDRVSGNSWSSGGYCTSEGQTSGLIPVSLQAPSSGPGRKFQVPTGQGITHLVLNLYCTDTIGDTLDGNPQLEEGQLATAYEPYEPSHEVNPDYIPKEQVIDRIDFLEDSLGGEVEENNPKLVTGGKVYEAIDPLVAEIGKLSPLIIQAPKKNLLNPENFDFTKRYSPGGGSVAGRGGTIYAGSGYIPVEEGKWYTYSIQDKATSPDYSSGGYCTSEGQTSGLIPIDYVVPVDGKGRCFQVPMGLGITHVYLNLLCIDTASNVLDGNHQLEEGEQATEYEEYQLVDKIDPKYLPETTTSTVDDKQYEKYTTFGNLSYAGISDRISNFRKHWIAKDKDLVVVNTGTSLTARSVEHCTEHPKANERPPLMHSYNFASHIWDKLKWEGQHYRRYDYPGFFAEIGSFQTQANVAEWDDGAYRNGLTRFSDGNAASIEFQIPVGAWQFNFIYRSDSVSSEVVTVDIAEGNGKVEVWNGSAWVEANGYTFSQKEPAVVQLASITNINPETGSNQTLSNYQVKGNTTYQKRLKMRCKSGAIDSRSEAKTVTISASTGRLTYWGVEWSVREHMITLINAARGSHSSLITSAATNLSKYQDNEIWSFEPDLLITEDPIHNSGAAGNLTLTRPKAYYARVTENFFFNPDNSVSIVASADRHSLPVPEMVIFNSSIAWNFNGIDEDGELIIYNIVDGQWTALDAQMSCWEYVTENHPDVVYINAVKTWCEAGRAIFGDLKTATSGSGKNGKTFTNEGSHWNDTGCRVMARVVLPVLDFIV